MIFNQSLRYALVSILFSIAWCLPVMSQAQGRVPEIVNIQTPMLDPLPVIPRDKPGTARYRKNDLLATPIIHLRASAADLHRKIEHLQKTNADLQSVSGRTTNDLQTILSRSEEIIDLVTALHDEMGLPAAEEKKTADNSVSYTAQNLTDFMTLLNDSVKSFVDDPIAQNARTLDVKAISQTNEKLQRMIAVSSGLAALARVASGVKPSTHRKPGATKDEASAARMAYLQLNLDCDLWKPEMFTTAAAKVKSWRKLTINGVKLQVNYHRLSRDQITPLNECAWRPPVVGFVSPETYSVAINEFLSYEVNGKVLAYQPTYTVWRTRNGKSDRLDQRLYLYFIDEGGRGAFDLYTGNKPLTEIPDWAREASAKP